MYIRYCDLDVLSNESFKKVLLGFPDIAAVYKARFEQAATVLDKRPTHSNNKGIPGKHSHMWGKINLNDVFSMSAPQKQKLSVAVKQRLRAAKLKPPSTIIQETKENAGTLSACITGNDYTLQTPQHHINI
jgi:hypothetical protein